jgi:hypothetical protein
MGVRFGGHIVDPGRPSDLEHDTTISASLGRCRRMKRDDVDSNGRQMGITGVVGRPARCYFSSDSLLL